MMPFFNKPHRRHPFELQLTAMIDIFSMIVIFLIMGTVFTTSDIAIPKDLKLPFSVNHDSAELAPQLTITKDSVTFTGSDTAIPLDAFVNSEDSRLGALKARIHDIIQRLPSEARKTGALLNVVADRETPYKEVFDVVRVFRSSGFQTLLFVASGAGTAVEAPVSGHK